MKCCVCLLPCLFGCAHVSVPFADVNAQIRYNVDQVRTTWQHKLEIPQGVSKVECDPGTFAKDYKRPHETLEVSPEISHTVVLLSVIHEMIYLSELEKREIEGEGDV